MSTDPNPTESAPSSAEEPSPTQSTPGPAAHGRRFKHRELDLADGGRLVLRADGSIA